MEPESMKLLAAALALLPMGAAAVALGLIFSSYNEAAGRNPTSAEVLDKKYFLSMAFTEALGIFSFVLAILIFLSQMIGRYGTYLSGAAFIAMIHASSAFAAGSEHGGLAQEAGHSAPGLPQLDPSSYASQVFWLLITFSSLYIIFSTKILPDLSGAIEKRRAQIQNDLDEAGHLQKTAEMVKQEYERMMEEAHVSSAALFLKAEETIKRKTTKKLSGFQARAAKAIRENEQEIIAAKDQAMSEIHDIVAEVASHVAEKIVGLPADVDQAKTLIKNISKKAA